MDAFELQRPGMVCQALRTAAQVKRREARARHNSGPDLAEHRARLRERADQLVAEAAQLEQQLRVRHRPAAQVAAGL